MTCLHMLTHVYTLVESIKEARRRETMRLEVLGPERICHKIKYFNITFGLLQILS